MEVIEAVRRTLAQVNLSQTEDSQIQIIRPIGEGTVSEKETGIGGQGRLCLPCIITL